MILALDLSTSCVGVTLFEDYKLFSVGHVEPKIKKEDISGHKNVLLYDKAEIVFDYICEIVGDKHIETIVIEEALISSSNIFTAAMLNFYQGIIFSLLKTKFNKSSFDFISVDEARRTTFPELVSKNTLYKEVPKVINGVKIKDYRKLLVAYLISKRYPQLQFDLNKNLTLCESNFDMADSIIVGTAYMIKNNLIKIEQHSLDEAIEFITQYLTYLTFVKKTKGSVKEKNALKRSYLENILKISNFINVKYG